MPNEERIGMYDNQQNTPLFREFNFCRRNSEDADLLQKFREAMKPSKPQRKRRASLYTKAEIKRATRGAEEMGWKVVTFKKGDVAIEMARQPQLNNEQNEWDEIISQYEGKW